jgi:hypothetical protein
MFVGEKMGILEASQCDRRGFRNEGSGFWGRWSVKRKGSVVLELLHGGDLEAISHRSGVTAATRPGLIR